MWKSKGVRGEERRRRSIVFLRLHIMRADPKNDGQRQVSAKEKPRRSEKKNKCVLPSIRADAT